jgi:hypothetical protein
MIKIVSKESQISIVGDKSEIFYFPCECGNGGWTLELNKGYYLNSCPCGRKYYVELRLVPLIYEAKEVPDKGWCYQ